MRDFAGLHEFLTARQSMPFAWGDHANDCVSAAAAAIVAQGGVDLLAGMHWSSEEEAYAALDAAGGLEAAVDAYLEPIVPALAKRGDIGAITAGNGLILVVVEGDTIVAPGPDRLRRMPRSMLVKSWSSI